MSIYAQTIAISFSAVIVMCAVTASAVSTCCPDTFIPCNPTVNAPDKLGNLIDTTTADPNSSVINVKVVKLEIFNRSSMLLFELSSGDTISLSLSMSGNVTLQNELAAETFEVDVENTRLWNGFEGVSLFTLQQYLLEQYKRGRLCRYNRVDRHSGVFVRQVQEHFCPHDE